ncbi:MAG: TIGR00341 family protein [Promethearchaeota archaeon]
MKQVQVVLPAGEGWQIKEKLGEEFGYISHIDGRTSDLLLFSVSDARVGPLLTELNVLGAGTKHGEITVTSITTRIPTIPSRARIQGRSSIEEIYEDMRAKAPFSHTYIVYTLLAGIIAGLGLVTDNLVAILASMIIAPLMSPIVSASFGIVVSDRSLFKKSVITEAFGLIMAMSMGVVVGFSMDPAYATSEMLSRTSISLVEIVIALVSGLAVGVSVSEKKESEVIGIAVAAALMPPAVNVGIFLWMGFDTNSQKFLDLSYGSLELLIINVVAIHVVTVVIFKFRGIRPVAEWRARFSRQRILRNIAILLIIVLAISLPIVIAASNTFIRWRVESQTIEIVNEQFEDIGISDIENIEISVSGSHVNVTISVLSSKVEEAGLNVTTDLPTLIFDIETEIQNQTDHKAYVIINLLESKTIVSP